MTEHLMGIDIGSSGCKVSIFNLEDRKFRTFSSEYPTYYPKPGWAEQDPEDWINSLRELIKTVLGAACCQSEEISAIGMSGVTHSLLMLDNNRKTLGRTIHLTDGRSSRQAYRLEKLAGDLILNRCLNPVGVMWTISMLDWVRENDRDRWKKMSKILFPKDYIRYRLTGVEATDEVDAQGTLLYDPIIKQWDKQLTELIGLNMNILPEIKGSIEIAGKITKEGQEWSGLSPGTPVITGTTDTLLEIFAAGLNSIGECTVKLATFGRICVLDSKPYAGKDLINYSYILPDLWYPGTGTRSCGTSLKWCRDQFYKELQKEEDVYPIMMKDAKSISPGAEGLIFHPYLQGEGSPYDDPHLRGDFLGLSLHHNRSHLVRAVIEGVAFSLLDSIQSIKEKGIKIKPPLKFIGGGAKSDLWINILADVLGYDAIVPKNSDPSVGAAILAGVGNGVFKNLLDGQKINNEEARKIKYSKNNNKLYNNYFKFYKKTQSLLSDIYHDMADE
jgi:xylulokinase